VSIGNARSLLIGKTAKSRKTIIPWLLHHIELMQKSCWEAIEKIDLDYK